MFFALRASAAHSASLRDNLSIETYFQSTLSGGFLTIGQDVARLTRSLLVGATFGSRLRAQCSLTPHHFSRGTVVTVIPLESRESFAGNGGEDGTNPLTTLEEEHEDHPRTRALVRSIFGIAGILFLAAIILGTISGGTYNSAVGSGAHAMLIRQLWYVLSSAVILPSYANTATRACLTGMPVMRSRSRSLRPSGLVRSSHI